MLTVLTETIRKYRTKRANRAFYSNLPNAAISSKRARLANGGDSVLSTEIAALAAERTKRLNRINRTK